MDSLQSEAFHDDSDVNLVIKHSTVQLKTMTIGVEANTTFEDVKAMIVMDNELSVDPHNIVLKIGNKITKNTD